MDCRPTIPVPIAAALAAIVFLGSAAAQDGTALLQEETGAIQEETLAASPVTQFKGAGLGGRVDGLVWRGGIVLTSPSTIFGGLSSATFPGQEDRLVLVNDRGFFVSGQLLYDEAGAPFGLVGVTIEPMKNSRGVELPWRFARDAEAVDTIYRDGRPAAVRVGFENLTRVADFDLVDSRPGGAAREIAIPQWLTDARTNESIEALCIAPDASPVAGSTLIVAENERTPEGNHRATLLGVRDKGDLAVTPIDGVAPTDCAFLPNGDLLLLERGIAFFTFTMRLRRIPAADIRPGAVLGGEVVLNASGNDIDNMEALAVHAGPGGETRITIISDNNFNEWERNLLLEFALPEAAASPAAPTAPEAAPAGQPTLPAEAPPLPAAPAGS